MHKEKPNNPLAEKLYGMNSLPEGFGFSATRVWDQLEQQLQEKKRTPMLWLRYAAAIVLLASVGIFWMLMQGEPIPTKAIVRQIQVAPKSIKPSLKKLDQTVTDSKSNNQIVRTKFVKPANDPVQTTVNTASTQQEVPVTEAIAAVNPTMVATSNPSIVSIAVVSTKPAVKSTPVRKKYPVVHLYELYREPEPIYSKTAPKKITTEETEENPITETNRTWWLSKPKTVIITTLTDNQ